MTELSAFKYRVFLSYSDRDKPWARWLQAALENFPIDKALVGRDTPVGPVPRTLRPIYRDCETASADSSLSERTLAALRASQCLVVLCSPHAAKSHRVNEQIRRFTAIGRADRVIPVIIDGEPGTARECFPPALRFQLGPDRPLIDRRGEPVVAEARLDRDGKRGAEQRVVASVLCLGLDEIERRTRDVRKRRIRVRCSGVIAALVALTLACEVGLTWTRNQLSNDETKLERTLERSAALAGALATASRQWGLPRAVSVGALEKAEAVLGGMTELGRDPARSRLRKAALLIDFGGLYATFGNKDLAHGRIAAADGLLQALAAEAAGNPAWRRDLPALYAKLGETWRNQGKLDEALASRRSSLAIAERLASDPGIIERQHELALRYLQVGDAHLDLGALGPALTHYQSSLVVAEYLAAVDSGKARWQHGLLLAHERIGDVLRLRSDQAGALANYAESRAIAERLVAGDPANPEWQRALSQIQLKIGDVLAFQGKSEEALAAYRAGNAIADRLAAADSGNADRQRDLGISHERIGAVLEARGELEAAAAEYRSALVMAERVVAADPDDAVRQRDLAVAHRHFGDLARGRSDFAATLRHYAASHAVIRRLAAADPDDAHRQYDLGASHARMGLVLETHGDFTAALAEYEACVRIGSRFAAADPGNAAAQRDLAAGYQKLAAIHHRLGKSAQALAELQQGRAIMAALRQRDPEVEQWREELGFLEDRIAALEGRRAPPAMASVTSPRGGAPDGLRTPGGDVIGSPKL